MYTYHTDPGHGWLEVRREELISMGIAKDISPYSYADGERVYLEFEDDRGVVDMKDAIAERAEIVTALNAAINLISAINTAFYVDGTRKALNPVMDRTKPANDHFRALLKRLED